MSSALMDGGMGYGCYPGSGTAILAGSGRLKARPVGRRFPVPATDFRHLIGGTGRHAADSATLFSAERWFSARTDSSE